MCVYGLLVYSGAVFPPVAVMPSTANDPISSGVSSLRASHNISVPHHPLIQVLVRMHTVSRK